MLLRLKSKKDAFSFGFAACHVILDSRYCTMGSELMLRLDLLFAIAHFHLGA